MLFIKVVDEEMNMDSNNSKKTQVKTRSILRALSTLSPPIAPLPIPPTKVHAKQIPQQGHNMAHTKNAGEEGCTHDTCAQKCPRAHLYQWKRKDFK